MMLLELSLSGEFGNVKNRERLSMTIQTEIAAIKARLDEGDKEMKVLKESLIATSQATQTIAGNTAPLLELYTDLAAGTRFLCRCAMAVQWFLEMVEKYYKRMLILAAIVWAISHNFHLPDWAQILFRMR